jgi:hypothetical protein
MKCSHPMCNRGLGLVSHRRWFGRGLYCSRRCRDNYAVARANTNPPPPADAKLFAWLLALPNAYARQQLAPATVRMRAR